MLIDSENNGTEKISLVTPTPVLAYFQFAPRQLISVIFFFKILHWRKCIWKCMQYILFPLQFFNYRNVAISSEIPSIMLNNIVWSVKIYSLSTKYCIAKQTLKTM